MSALVNFAGWFILPNLATGVLQNFYYKIVIRAGDPAPQPSSLRFQRDRKRIYILVILLYLTYTVCESIWTLRRGGDLYSLLGVAPDADDRSIRSAFNQLARTQHPDKALPQNRNQAQDYFVQLKKAKDTLLNPTKRFAYDRLGPGAANCVKCLSTMEYVQYGTSMALVWYGITGGFMILLQVLGYAQWGSYWRWVAFAGLLLNDMASLTRPYPLAYLRRTGNAFLPFQANDLLKGLLVTLSIACNQLGPILNQGPVVKTASIDDQIQRMEQLSRVVDAESTALLGVDMAPFMGDEAVLSSLKVRLRDWLVEQTIRSDPEVRDAVGNVLAKRRSAPPGARGTK